MSNIITQEETKTKDFAFDEQPLHTPISAQNVILAKTMANHVDCVKLDAPAGSITSLTFSHRTTVEDFVDNGVILRVTLPIKIDKRVAPTVPIDRVTYVREFFNDFSELALKPNGLANAIEHMTVSLNGKQISSVSNMGAQIASIFPYYDESAVNEFFEASAPDRFQRYQHYDGNSDAIKTLCPYDNRDEVRLSNSPRISDESIFANSYKLGTNTRKPVLVYESIVGSTFTGKITLETYLPLSIFGLKGGDTAIYGIRDFDINVQLKAEPVSYIFSVKESGTDIDGVKTLPYTRLYLDTSKTSQQNASLQFVKRRAVDIINKGMKDDNQLVKDYLIEYSDTRTHNTLTKTVQGHRTASNLTLATVNSSSVPKAIYIAALRKMTGSSVEMSSTPTVFGRISDLTIRMNGTPTLYTKDAGTLYNICKGNGLNTDREMGLYTAGFPLRFDVANDISAGGLSFIGESKQCNFDIDLSVTNLDDYDHDYEIFVTLVYQTYLECTNGDFKTSNALIDQSMIPDLSNFGQHRFSQRAREIRMIGGGFWGDLWGNVKKGAKKLGNYILENPAEAINTVRTFIGRGSTNNVMGGATTNNIIGGSQVPTLGAGNTGVKNVLGGRAVKSATFK